MLNFTPNLLLFCVFQLFSTKNAENDYFDQRNQMLVEIYNREDHIKRNKNNQETRLFRTPESHIHHLWLEVYMLKQFYCFHLWTKFKKRICNKMWQNFVFLFALCILQLGRGHFVVYRFAFKNTLSPCERSE